MQHHYDNIFYNSFKYLSFRQTTNTNPLQANHLQRIHFLSHQIHHHVTGAHGNKPVFAEQNLTFADKI